MKQLGKKIIWQRAEDYIKKYNPLLIGITGSTGKTITKDAIGVALGKDQRIRIAPHSYNTPIGVALSIIGIDAGANAHTWFSFLIGSKAKEIAHPEPEIIVLELGADRPGDIDMLATKLPFKIGVVTNAQSTHLRLFQDKKMVAHEMMSLIVKMQDDKDAKAILNSDDPLVKEMHQHSKVATAWYGSDKQSDIKLARSKRTAKGGFACEVVTPIGVIELHLQNVIASHYIPHILAALSVVHALNEDLKQAAKRLQKFTPPAGRMRLFEGLRQSKIIDDSYSASPEGMLAALDTLDEIKSTRKIAVLGSMLDLGGASAGWHERVGEKAEEVADILITIGDDMRHGGSAALQSAGEFNNKIDVHHFNNSKDVGKWLVDFIQPDDLVLVKGSRDMRMETIVESLLVGSSIDKN